MFDATQLNKGDVIEYLALRGGSLTTKRGRIEYHAISVDGESFRVKRLGAEGKLTGEEDFIDIDDVIGIVDSGELVDPGRVDWDHYFMDIARQVASRSTCDRKHVGAVIVRNKTILSTGYNGSIRGIESCRERGHMMEDGHCVRTVHAEANAIVQAAKNGSMVDGAELYTSASPCWWCFKLLANGGIHKIVVGEIYRDNRIGAMSYRCGIELKILDPEGKS